MYLNVFDLIKEKIKINLKEIWLNFFRGKDI